MPIETHTITRQGPSGKDWTFTVYRSDITSRVLVEAHVMDKLQHAEEINTLRETIRGEFLADAGHGELCASCKAYIPTKDIIRVVDDPEQRPVCDHICASHIDQELRDQSFISRHGMHAFRGVNQGDF